jgi:hypothetical protein
MLASIATRASSFRYENDPSPFAGRFYNEQEWFVNS